MCTVIAQVTFILYKIYLAFSSLKMDYWASVYVATYTLNIKYFKFICGLNHNICGRLLVYIISMLDALVSVL